MSRADDLAFAHRLADAAGEAIRPWFRARVEVETKGDASPVTVADRAAETAMRTLIAAERPGDGIIGEEFGVSNPGAARVWVLDPIDGTRSFIAGRPIFGTLIALLEENRPVLGIIDQPIGRDRWAGAEGRATTLNGAAITTRRCPALSMAFIASSGPQYFDAPQRARFEALSEASGQLVYGGDCYNYGLVAAGHIDLVVEANLKLHDFAALAPIVIGAGGSMTDWQGRPLTGESDGSVIALGDTSLLPEVSRRLRD
ncbi:histidinol-phosphatase [Sphingosinicella soli]|uniref:Histidinol-phosphatase n=1 Tax=Sphingosinicella soli TaxID=333708 RepID=A0A7W7AYX0_9SPHN|nr:histidinol-phosphatase [Sphingosinicella soli]MBB4630916.1 histidinol phosphatase-like enzyme (inositol monophosphatase family) [Sphingosinicella soli]